MVVKLRVGTSGFSYAEWKGSFYPEKLPAKAMLQFYAQHFKTCEINATFYRMPSESLLAGFAGQVPEDFEFVLKAPRRITHVKAWGESLPDIGRFIAVARTLGVRLGPLLFQLPPYARKDLLRLNGLIAAIGPDVRVALEVRHPSWLDDEVYAYLNDQDVALCVSDDDAERVKSAAELPDIATWGYLRLRKTDYATSDLREWSATIAARPWKEAYVFFKHEDSGSAPRFATQFSTQL
ncbi:MAG: DUF72 domain-containing protein [Clostridia bacterium]|nr:DUF72 domain-containing protein [Deltaproteobacteria bacterium]